MILFPNIAVLILVIFLVFVDFFIKRMASRKVIENLPVLFTTRVISFCLCIATFMLFVIIQPLLPDRLASTLIGLQPSWQILGFILLVSAREPSVMDNFKHYFEALLLSIAIPVIVVISVIQLDMANDLAIIIAQAFMSVILLIVIYKKYSSRIVPAALVMWTFGIGLITYFVSSESDAYYAWVLIPVILYVAYIKEVNLIRRQYHKNGNYIDFSIINSGFLNGRRITLEEGAPGSMGSYRKSYLLSSIGFTIDSPYCYMINELHTLDMQDFLRLLARERRSKDWNMSLMYLMDCARAVYQVHANYPKQTMFLELNSFVFCKDTVKIRQEIGKCVISPIYKSPIPGYQSDDLYALGVICWQIMHPTHHFKIKWKNDVAEVYFSNVVCLNVQKMITRLLSRNPNLRPSASEVYFVFQKILMNNLHIFVDFVKLDYAISGRKLMEELSHYANKIECLRLCNLMVSWSIIHPVSHIEENNIEFMLEAMYVTDDDCKSQIIHKTIHDDYEDEVNSIEL